MKSVKNLHPARAKRCAPLLLAAIAVLLFVTTAVARAEQLYSEDWGYSLDLPEGYALQAKDGSSRFAFANQLFPVTLQIALYPREQWKSAEEALKNVTGQLSSTGPLVSFAWRQRDASISRIEAKELAGWSVALELANKKGWLVMACVASPDKAVALEPLIISTLDTVYTDEGSWFEPGPMTAFAWASDGPTNAEVRFGGETKTVPFAKIDAEANQAIIDREFSLLTGYLDTEHMYAAWKRYYRMIYRDSWTRLERAIFAINSLLPKESEKAAAALLSWTQGFTYERNREGADFLNLPEAMTTLKGDCDSRALLLVIMLNQMGVDAILLVSPEYSHALAAIDCPGEGARFSYGKKKYLIADTTAKVGLGMIAEDMANPDKWFAVAFPAFPQP